MSDKDVMKSQNANIEEAAELSDDMLNDVTGGGSWLKRVFPYLELITLDQKKIAYGKHKQGADQQSTGSNR